MTYSYSNFIIVHNMTYSYSNFIIVRELISLGLDKLDNIVVFGFYL